VIQPDPELIETARAGSVGERAQLHSAVQLGQMCQGDVSVRLDVAADFFHAEQAAVPSCAPVNVADSKTTT
jgi:hypothetical protein